MGTDPTSTRSPATDTNAAGPNTSDTSTTDSSTTDASTADTSADASPAGGRTGAGTSGTRASRSTRHHRRHGRHAVRRGGPPEGAHPTPAPDDAPTTGPDAVPNHHGDHPGFAGASGAAMAALFAVVGRGRARLVADLARVGPDDLVIDIGCGPGNAVREAARRGATAVGVDPAPVMLRVARLLTRPGRGVEWYEGSAESLPALDASASVVWSVACVHHWADLDRGLAEVHRVLVPGGRFLAVERHSDAGAEGVAGHGWTDDQAERFAERFRAAGFTDVEIRRHGSDRGPVLAVRGVRA